MAEVKFLRARPEDLHGSMCICDESEPPCENVVLAFDYDALAARCAAAEKDAARYRWLREGDYPWRTERMLRDSHGWLMTDDDLDAAIDAAMAATQEKA